MADLNKLLLFSVSTQTKHHSKLCMTSKIAKLKALGKPVFVCLFDLIRYVPVNIFFS